MLNYNINVNFNNILYYQMLDLNHYKGIYHEDNWKNGK